MERKAKFAWASIAGADPEPVEIIEENGRIGVYTCGCADPFWLDDESAGVRINHSSMYRPSSVMSKEEVEIARKKYDEQGHSRHGWRGPR